MIRTITIGGFMGVGKTSVGQCVARRMGVRFVDLDQLVESRVRMPVHAIFQEMGEDGFRQQEAAGLESVLRGPPVVLALGGGTLHFGDNCEQILSRSDLVCLGMPLEHIQERLRAESGDRPLWKEAATLFERRAPLYRSVGTYIDVTDLSVEDVAVRVQEVCRCA